MHLCYCAVCIQIAVILLGETDLIDESIVICIQFRIRKCLKGECSSFYYFEYIGIIKRVNCLKSAGIKPSGYFEVLYPACRLTVGKCDRNSDIRIFLILGAQKLSVSFTDVKGTG